MRLVVPGEARGKGRPRFARGRTYTDTPTLRAEQRIADEWRAQGRVMLPPDLPLDITVVLYLERPKGHYRKDGSLSTAGLRCPVPIRKPDIDNALKLVCDALNGLAYRDDVQIADAHIYRRWAPDGPYTSIEIVACREDGADLSELEAA